MNVLVRGRIRDGEWVDQQTIWHTDIENYTAMPDMAAGGRIAFDGKGHVFFSVGIKGGSEFAGVQDLNLPYGKIHRVNDDGSIPADNPFVEVPGRAGEHLDLRSSQPRGARVQSQDRQALGNRDGPARRRRGQSAAAGRNYGWPLTSKGVNYDGTPVDYGKRSASSSTSTRSSSRWSISRRRRPCRASSSTTARRFRNGGNLLVGTLKATELYRMEVDGDEVVHRETLLTGLGRIRDVAVGPDGLVYLLLEHASGGRIVRLVPAT